MPLAGEKLYAAMYFQHGVVSDDIVERTQTETLRDHARIHGLDITDVKKFYEEPFDKALRSVRQQVVDAIPQFMREDTFTGGHNLVLSIYQATAV